MTPQPRDRLVALGNQLIATHIRIREYLAQLRNDVDDYLELGGERPRDLWTHCLAFCSAVTEHHTDEDDTIFPLTARHFPQLRPVIEVLERDHRQVAEMVRTLRALLDGLGLETDPAQVKRLHGEIDGVAALLESHFVYEEKQIVAALNSLGPVNPDG